MAGLQGKSRAQTRAEDRIAAVRIAAVRNSANKKRQAEVPDVYQEMLSEAASSPEPAPRREYRPLKKRRLEEDDRDTGTLSSSMSPMRTATGSKARSIIVPTNQAGSEIGDQPRPQQTIEDSSDSEDEDLDWEEIGFDQGDAAAVPSRHAPFKDTEDEIADISVEVGPKKTPKKTALKRKPATTVEKLLRLAVHEAHVLFLIFHLHVRNSWCNLDAVQSKLKSFLPLKVIGLLHPREDVIQFSRSESFINGLKLAVDLWQAKFRVVESGMRKPYWAESADEIKKEITLISDEIRAVDKPGFVKRASSLSGSQDVGNQLFCALLRSVGLEARLVCSLQALPFGTTGAKTGTPLNGKRTLFADLHSDGGTSAEEGSANGSASETSITPKGRIRRFARPGFAIGGSSVPAPVSRTKPAKKTSPARKLDYPVFWVEVFNAAYQRWVPVDATVTGSINKPAKLEPPASYNQNTMSYVVAFEDHGYARDVTKRYTKAYNAKTRKLRVELTETGQRWWKKVLKPFRRRARLDRDQVEDAELAKKEAQEGLPNNVQDFKGHPYYALERHLKRHEVLFPKRPVGKVNAGKSSSSNVENVYRRSDVQLVRSADKWYRVGREIKPGEQPLKRVPARRSPRERDDPDEEAPTTALYAYSQTSLYVPPPVVNGRITKNAFGNLDVYVPSMVPPGAVHIRRPLAVRAAKVLGIDFADAVTGFKFKGRIGEAVKNGIVVASEFGEAVEAVVDGFQDAAQEEEDAKRSLESLRLWKRFLTGMRIGVRLGLYDGVGVGEASPKIDTVRKELNEAENKQDEAMDAGGFFPDAAEETVPTVNRFGNAAQPRSLLAIAQEAEQNASEEDIGEQAPRLRRQRNVPFVDEDDKDEPGEEMGEMEEVGEIEEGEEEEEEEEEEEAAEVEDIQKHAPRLRRQRKVSFGSDSNSEEEFVPEPVRPPPSRRTRGKAETSQSTQTPRDTLQTAARRTRGQTKSAATIQTPSVVPVPATPAPKKSKTGRKVKPPTAGPTLRRSTRVTRSQAKLAKEASIEEEDQDESVSDMGNDDVVESGGGSLPGIGHAEAEEFGGGFLPDAGHAEAEEPGGGFLPDAGHAEAEETGGGFVPASDEAEKLDGFLHAASREEAGEYGRGFLPEPMAGQAANDDAADFGGGFIPDDDTMDVESKDNVFDSRDGHDKIESSGFISEGHDLDQYDGGFIPEADDPVNQTDHGRQSASYTEKSPISATEKSVVEFESSKAREEPMHDDDDQEILSEDDRGSLLSHDPEDEDAEPEWLS